MIGASSPRFSAALVLIVEPRVDGRGLKPSDGETHATSRDTGDRLFERNCHRSGRAAGAASTTFFDAFLKAGGTSRSDFNIINVDTTALTSTYVTRAADAVLTTVAWSKPQVDVARPSRPIFFSDVGLLIPGYGLIVRKDTIDAKSDILKRFVEVQQKTWVYIFAGHEQEAIDAILAQRPGLRLDGAIMLAQLNDFMPLFETPAT